MKMKLASSVSQSLQEGLNKDWKKTQLELKVCRDRCLLSSCKPDTDICYHHMDKCLDIWESEADSLVHTHRIYNIHTPALNKSFYDPNGQTEGSSSVIINFSGSTNSMLFTPFVQGWYFRKRVYVLI